MLTEICAYLRNHFDRDSSGNRIPSWTEDISITGRELVGFSDRLLPGQYFRILDSNLNDGVHMYGDEDLNDEEFLGTIQPMRIPPAVVEISQELKSYREKYADVIESPISSENFFGYSWSAKASGSEASPIPDHLAKRLAPWRKI